MTPLRYLTLAEARSLECNGCGDCCDSRRTDGFWSWPALPRGQYRRLGGGEPLIIPLERIGDGWQDRAPLPADARSLTPTRFRCTAFTPQPDGSGLCGIHDRRRPKICGEFPVFGKEIERRLAQEGRVRLQTGAFPRCTWHNVCVTADSDPILARG